MASDAALPRTIAEAGEWMASGRVSSVELTHMFLDRIASRNPELSAYITVTPEAALAGAEAMDRERKAGKVRGPMHGVPYAAKDLFATRGIRTTAHSKVLEDFIPDFDAACVERMRDAGGVLLGKLATHEFGFGGPAFDLPFPPARNPHDPERIPGGSSSGAGAALGADLCAAALAGDGGGSIRSPSALCGVVGIKPTFGRVSRFGGVALSPSLDHAGPMGRSVDDCEILLEILSGFDARDPATSAASGYVRPPPTANINGLSIAVPTDIDVVLSGITDAQRAAHEAVVAALQASGAEVVEIDVPEPELMFATSRAIIFAEAFAGHAARLRSTPNAYCQTTREKLLMGAFVDASDYLAAKALQPRLTAVYDRFFERFAALVMPAQSGAARPFAHYSRPAPMPTGVDVAYGFNVTGHPILIQPCGRDGHLPLATQIVGARFGEANLFRVGRALGAAVQY